MVRNPDAPIPCDHCKSKHPGTDGCYTRDWMCDHSTHEIYNVAARSSSQAPPPATGQPAASQRTGSGRAAGNVLCGSYAGGAPQGQVATVPQGQVVPALAYPGSLKSASLCDRAATPDDPNKYAKRQHYKKEAADWEAELRKQEREEAAERGEPLEEEQAPRGRGRGRGRGRPRGRGRGSGRRRRVERENEEEDLDLDAPSQSDSAAAGQSDQGSSLQRKRSRLMGSGVAAQEQADYEHDSPAPAIAASFRQTVEAAPQSGYRASTATAAGSGDSGTTNLTTAAPLTAFLPVVDPEWSGLALMMRPTPGGAGGAADPSATLGEGAGRNDQPTESLPRPPQSQNPSSRGNSNDDGKSSKDNDDGSGSARPTGGKGKGKQKKGPTDSDMMPEMSRGREFQRPNNGRQFINSSRSDSGASSIASVDSMRTQLRKSSLEPSSHQSSFHDSDNGRASSKGSMDSYKSTKGPKQRRRHPSVKSSSVDDKMNMFMA